MSRFLRWKWLIRFGVLALILALALPLAARWYVRTLGQSRLTAAIQRLDESDPTWTKDALCAERNAKLPPPEKNSFTVIRQVCGALPKEFDSRKDPLEEARRRPPNHLLREEELQEVRKFVADYPEAIASAKRLIDYSEGGRIFEFSEMPIDTNLEEIQKIRGVAWLLSIDAILAANDQRGPDAIRDARALLNAARAIGDEPCLISQLVRSACAAIACRTASAALGLTEVQDGLPELQAELLREAEFPRLVCGFRGERASSHQIFRLMETGDINRLAGPGGVPGTGGGLLDRIGMMAFRTYLPDDHAFSLEMMTAYVEAGLKPFDEQLAAVRSAPTPKDGDRRYMLTNLLTPAIQKMVDSALRTRGDLLAAAVAIACERHRQRTGSWPENLDAIAKDILAVIPNDPFTGKPIAFRRLSDGVVVYTIGPDGKDDGGNIFERPGSGRTQSDFGARLWNPALRRQPAPPPESKEPEEPDPGPGRPGGPDR